MSQDYGKDFLDPFADGYPDDYSVLGEKDTAVILFMYFWALVGLFIPDKPTPPGESYL